MKRIIILSAAMLTACSKPELKIIEQSSEAPHISVCGTEGRAAAGNNIFVVSPDAQNIAIDVSSSIPVIPGRGEAPATSRSSFVSEGDGVGRFRFSSAGNPGYTVDNPFVLEQSVREDTWYEFPGYGPVETYINFRIRGKLGTEYIDISRPGIYTTDRDYFIRGRLTAISQTSIGTEEFVSQKANENYFREWGYVPQRSYEAEYATLTIATASGCATVTVYGKRRDGDIDALKRYVQIGDTVEVPAVFRTADDIISGHFGKVLTCRVLKL